MFLILNHNQLIFSKMDDLKSVSLGKKSQGFLRECVNRKKS